MKDVLILGGIRSGKSEYAEKLLQSCEQVSYIALAQIYDDEMAERVLRHQKRRKSSWKTVETSTDLVLAIQESKGYYILIDSIGTWVSNILMQECPNEQPFTREERNRLEQRVLEQANQTIRVLKQHDYPVIIVSEEVGYSMVSEYPLGRLFTDLLGTINQRFATYCTYVYLMAAGYPLKVKDEYSLTE